MRTLRKLFLYTLTALATTMITASTASAEVAVSDTNGQSCWEVTCEVTIDGGWRLNNSPWNGVSPGKCDDIEITMSVSGSGELTAHTIDVDDSGNWQWGGCFYYFQDGFFDDCIDAGWSGQIIGPGDEWYSGYAQSNVAYTGLGDFEAVFDTCFQGYYNNHPARWDSIKFGFDNQPTGPSTWSYDEQPYGPHHTLAGYGANDWDGPASADLQVEDL
jgi:hypothetical protein